MADQSLIDMKSGTQILRPDSDLRSLSAGGLNLMSLVVPRWIAIVGQIAAVLVVKYAFGFDLPFWPCLLIIAASSVLNIALWLRYPPKKLLSDREAATYLAFDILQLTALLYFTGGLQNPFFILFLAPVTVSASNLSARSTIILMVMAFVCVSLIGVFAEPLPWFADTKFDLHPIYQVGLWVSIALGLGFLAIYAWRIAAEARRMSAALAATQYILAREQRLSAVGGLAAAAAHELGTPLGTIALVAKELQNEIGGQEEIDEDLDLLQSQVQRCREILGQLSADPHLGDIVYDRMDLGTLLHELADNAADGQTKIDIKLLPHERFVEGEELIEEPVLVRRPEITYGLSNFVNNAMHFATSEVIISADWDGNAILVKIEDDGSGFAPRIFDQLGDPYLTTRPRSDRAGSSDEYEGMGLGIFIAKTLIERSGGKVEFENKKSPGMGAIVSVRWPKGISEPKPT